jgi:hypothetical protein
VSRDVWLCCCGVYSINQSIILSSVAMTVTEEFMPAVHQKALGLIVLGRFTPLLV